MSRRISRDQLIELIDTAQDFVLVDTLPHTVFDQGHLCRAITINTALTGMASIMFAPRALAWFAFFARIEKDALTPSPLIAEDTHRRAFPDKPGVKGILFPL